jgi:DNA-binding transcriptional LysR family regulator
MDKLRNMEVFLSVIDNGSFSAAGRSLDMSTVMVSKHIAELEQRIGTRLLNRTTRSLSLTEIGTQYSEQCRQILQLIQTAETGTQAMRATPRGTLKLSAPVAFGSVCLAPAMSQYLIDYPDISLELDLSNRLADVIEEGLDAAIRIGKLDDSSLIARPLRTNKMAICASPEYLERKGTPRTPADLWQHQCLDFMHWRSAVRWRLKQHDEQNTLPASRFRSNNGQALLHAAIAGFGLVMQAEVVLADEIRAGRLVPVLETYIPTPKPMHLIYPKNKQSTPKLSTFVDFVMARFGL